MSGQPDELKLWVRSQICIQCFLLYILHVSTFENFMAAAIEILIRPIWEILYISIWEIRYIWQVSTFYDGSSNRNLNWSNPRNPCLWICLKLRRLTSRTQFVTRKRMSSSSSSPLPSPSILFSASHELIKLDLSCFKSGVCRHNLTTRRIWDDLFLQIGPFQGIY